MERRDGTEQQLEVLAAQLKHPERIYDTLAGNGVEGFLGDPDSGVSVQVFPGSGIARIRTPLADLTLRRAQLEVDEERNALYLAAQSGEEWIRTHLYRNGSVIFSRLMGAIENPVDSELMLPTSIPDGQSMHDVTPRDRTGAEDAGDSPPTGSGGQPDQETQPRVTQPRVTLSGRLGYAPKFRTTPRGTLVASFSIAVHEENQQTTWHNIRLFGEKAQKLQEQEYQKGQEIEVVGYVHRREKPGKDGALRTVEEIYAAVVKKPGAKDETSPKDNASGEV